MSISKVMLEARPLSLHAPPTGASAPTHGRAECVRQRHHIPKNTWVCRKKSGQPPCKSHPESKQGCGVEGSWVQSSGVDAGTENSKDSPTRSWHPHWEPEGPRERNRPGRAPQTLTLTKCQRDWKESPVNMGPAVTGSQPHNLHSPNSRKVASVWR